MEVTARMRAAAEPRHHTHTPTPGSRLPRHLNHLHALSQCQAPLGRQKGQAPALQNLVQGTRLQRAGHVGAVTPGGPAH